MRGCLVLNLFPQSFTLISFNVQRFEKSDRRIRQCPDGVTGQFRSQNEEALRTREGVSEPAATLPGAAGGAVRAAGELDRDRHGELPSLPADALRRQVAPNASRAGGRPKLSVCDRTPYEHGMTGGISFLLAEIERLACEGEPAEVLWLLKELRDAC